MHSSTMLNISSHISSDLENLCDDLYMLHDGHIIFHEDTDVLLSDYAVLKTTPEQFAALARKHPSQFMLSAIAADLLQVRKRRGEAIALLRNTAAFLRSAENRLPSSWCSLSCLRSFI